MRHIKRAKAAAEDRKVIEAVQGMLEDISKRGEDAVRDYAERFDNWKGHFVLTEDKKRKLIAQVPDSVKSDICFPEKQCDFEVYAPKIH